MRTGYHIAPIRWHMTVMLLVCVVFMVIGISTSSWAHYTWAKHSQKFGLWRKCSYNAKGATTGCEDAGYLIPQIVLILSVTFCALALLCIFCIINKILKKLTSILYIVCMVITATLGWAGIGLFVEEIERNKSTALRKYEWSFILLSTGVVVVTILLPFAIWYVFCEKRKDKKTRLKHDEKNLDGKAVGDAGVYGDGVVNKGIEVDVADRKPGVMEQPAEIVAGGGTVVLKTFTPLSTDIQKRVTIKSGPPSEAASQATIDEVASEEFESTTATSETSETSDSSYYSETETVDSEPVPVKKPGYSSLTLHSTDVALKDLESYLEKEEYSSYI